MSLVSCCYAESLVSYMSYAEGQCLVQATTACGELSIQCSFLNKECSDQYYWASGHMNPYGSVCTKVWDSC